MAKWTTLVTRYGSSLKDPSGAQLKAAIHEVFCKVDQEHPDAWIECGSDDGPLHVLSISFAGTSRFTKYSDADMTDELETVTQEGLDERQALGAWQALIAEQGR